MNNVDHQTGDSHSTAAAHGSDTDGMLVDALRGIRMALGANALTATWRRREHDEPLLLLAEGDDPNRWAADRARAEAERGPPGSAGVRQSDDWRVVEGDRLGGELSARITTDPGVLTVVGRFNRPGAATRARARGAGRHLLAVLRPCVRLWAARRVAMSRVRGLTAAVNRTDVGMMLVDENSELLFANAAAETLLEAKNGIRRQGRRLAAGRLADTLKLQATIEHAIASRSAAPSAQRVPLVELAREGRGPLLAAVVGSGDGDAPAEDGAAIIYLCEPDRDLTGAIETTCRHYGLSPIETRLTCYLAQGVALADAADTMRVREQTARSYLKQIFLKTETNRQAELVWLMLKNSIRTTLAA